MPGRKGKPGNSVCYMEMFYLYMCFFNPLRPWLFLPTGRPGGGGVSHPPNEKLEIS